MWGTEAFYLVALRIEEVADQLFECVGSAEVLGRASRAGMLHIPAGGYFESEVWFVPEPFPFQGSRPAIALVADKISLFPGIGGIISVGDPFWTSTVHGFF